MGESAASDNEADEMEEHLRGFGSIESFPWRPEWDARTGRVAPGETTAVD